MQDQSIWVQAQGIAQEMRSADKYPIPLQGIKSRQVHVSRHAHLQQSLITQYCGRPTFIPRGAATMGEFVKTRLSAQRQKYRLGRVIAHGGHPLAPPA